MAKKANYTPTLEQRLLENAVDTVCKNVDEFDPVVLLHLVSEVCRRKDLKIGLFRILSNEFPADELRAMGVEPGAVTGKMAGTGDELMNYLTLPRMHRVQLRGIQQLQEKLLPGGFLMVNKELTHTDASRLLAQCTTQLEKVLRLTKATRANAEVNRLKEAISAGLGEVEAKLGGEYAAKALELFKDGMRRSLTGTKAKLEEQMEEAERLGG